MIMQIYKSGLILFCQIFFLSGYGQEYRYSIEYDGKAVIFTTISGLDLSAKSSENKVFSRTSPLQRVNTVNGRSISLKGGACRSDNELYKWFCTFSQSTKQKRDITVKLLNANGDLIRTWKIRQAGPVKVEGPTLNAKGNDVAIETVVLSHEGIEPE
jgi:phage tail-like protein